MGNRANFGFKDNAGQVVFLYGHWAGHEMLKTFAKALKVMRDFSRNDDEAYGTRICISQIVGGDWNSQYGWGITMNHLSDNEHSIPVFDFASQRVTLYSYDWQRNYLGEPKFTMGLNQFIDKYI